MSSRERFRISDFPDDGRIERGRKPAAPNPLLRAGGAFENRFATFSRLLSRFFFFSWGRCWLKENKVVVVVDVVTSANERMDDKQRALTDGCVLRTRQLKRRTVK